MALTDTEVRLAVYRHFAEHGTAPTDLDPAALQRLADARLLVLNLGTTEIRMAQPFSAVPTAFRVEAGGRSYFGNCIWDALGIPALLGTDGTVSTTCADCGDLFELSVEDGRLYGAGGGVAHFAVPAVRWWEDIGHT